MDYKALISNVKDIHKNWIIVCGFIDVHLGRLPGHILKFDNYKVYIGDIEGEELLECFMETEYNVQTPGCYQFESVLKYRHPYFGDNGRVIYAGSWYIDFIDLKLDHTFEQRERDIKLKEFLGD